jgi:hypothetical protein
MSEKEDLCALGELANGPKRCFRSCIIAINENVIEDHRTCAYCLHMMLDGS